MALPLHRLSYMDPIRGFVAVGRRMSITQAAQDLFLSQSAVSRQISLLEEQIGVKLLTRNYRSIAFTPEGERLFRSADSAVQQLQDILDEIRGEAILRPVTLGTTIGVTGLWLLPRLTRFQEAYPGVDLRVSANNRVGDLRHDGVDLAIRYTTPDNVPATAHRLFGETIAPVANPSMGIGSLSSPEELAQVCLLEYDGPAPNHPWLRWRDWIDGLGWTGCKPRAFLLFNQYDQVIQAAVAGQGIALGRLGLIDTLLDQGKLALLDGPRPPPRSQHAYWLLHSGDALREDVRRVAEWIRSEAKVSETFCDR